MVPKELLLLGDRPLLHHALDEAARGGFESALIVVSPVKEESIRRYCHAADLPLPVEFAIQPQMAGLGDAVLHAGIPAPFAVLLPDDVVRDTGHWERLRELHSATGAAVLCVRPVPAADAPRFGMAECLEEGGRLRVRRLVEKPKLGDSPSELAVFGRYIVTDAVLEALRVLPAGDELQLTDGFASAAAFGRGVFAIRFEEEILDCGTPDEYARSSAIHWRRTEAGRDEEGNRLNQQLITQLRGGGLISSERVARAFAAVHRHRFLPELALDEVYRDDAIPTKFEDGIPISSSSQPAIMAIMLEQLRVEPGNSILEIGAGSGYNAGLLSHLVGPTGSVVSLDFDQDLVDSAASHLSSAGWDQVRVVRGDGAAGYLPKAPYDRIVLTVAAADIPPSWSEQLKPDGLLLLPLTLVAGLQKSVALQRRGDRWESISMRNCGFMPLRGELSDLDRQLPLAEGIGLAFEAPRRVDTERVLAWLRSTPAITDTGLIASLEESWGGLRFWLALADPSFAALNVQAPPSDLPDPPVLLGRGRGGRTSFMASCGMLDEEGIALLDRDQHSGRLTVRAYGRGAAAAARLESVVQLWDSRGRPDSERIRITVLAAADHYEPGPGETILQRRLSKLVISRL